LPGEVRSRGARDCLTQLVVLHARDRARDARIELDGARNLGRPELDRALRGLDGSDAESEGAYADAGGAEPRDERVGQKRELARPYAGRRAYDEDSVLDGHGHRSLGDSRADGGRPDVGRKGSSIGREAVFAGAREHVVERLRGDHPLPAASRHGRDRSSDSGIF
jgi:hypothetical protein